MELEKLKNISIDDKHKLIDLLEGMPSKVNSYVKLHLNDEEFNPSLFKGKIRILNQYSSLIRYINKNNLEITNSMANTYYQFSYCNLIHNINESEFPKVIKSKLINILNSESYDYESFSAMEVELSKILDECQSIDSNSVQKLAEFINNDFMLYKSSVFDFYTYLLLTYMDGIPNVSNNNINNMILMINHYLMNPDNESEYVTKENLSILIYLYFMDLGVLDCVEKYHLLNRFKYNLLLYNKSNDYIEYIEQKIYEYSLVKTGKIELLDRLIHPEIISHLLFPLKDNDMDNSIIIMSKNMNDFFGNEEFISQQIRVLNKKTIVEYLHGNYDESYITFFLTDNDYGHVKNTDGIDNIATVTDETEKDIKYIANYENELYLLFKNKLNTNIVYGISLNQNQNNRKIMEIKESKTYLYKYISEI